jgi:hypothetical protein
MHNAVYYFIGVLLLVLMVFVRILIKSILELIAINKHLKEISWRNSMSVEITQFGKYCGLANVTSETDVTCYLCENNIVLDKMYNELYIVDKPFWISVCNKCIKYFCK